MMEPEAVVAGNKACGIEADCVASPGPSRGGDARPGSAISIGDRVQLHSLDRSELNNLCGEIVKAINADTGRWGVKLELDGRELALKPANLIKLCDNGGNHAPRRRSSTAPGRLQAETVRSWSAAVQEAAQADRSVRGGGGEAIKPEAVAAGNETRGMEAACEAIPFNPRDFQSGAPAKRGGVVDICGGSACLSATTFRVRVCARSSVCPRPGSECSFAISPRTSHYCRERETERERERQRGRERERETWSLTVPAPCLPPSRWRCAWSPPLLSTP
jgi:hypothetical protein